MSIAPVKRNPYLVGSAISNPKFFFGRGEVFQFVEANLNEGKRVILLHGQRRIGKSSVILQIPNFVKSDRFVFIPFDLQNKGHLALSSVLHILAELIINQLKLELKVKLPSEADLADDPSIFYQNLLPEIYRLLGEKNMVLMLDEFDVLNSYDPTASSQTFFPYLQSLLNQHEQLFIIPVIGRRPDDLPKLLSLFREALTLKISLLSSKDTEKLITEPARDSLEYTQNSIQAIYDLSKGHPYFTQLLCYELFAQVRSEQKPQVTREDVERIVDDAIELGEGGLAWFRDGLPIPERVIFSAVAEAQEIANLRDDQSVEKPLEILKRYGVVQTESLLQAETQLIEWEFLDSAEGSNSENTHGYRVKVELVRRWLVKQHPLRREIWELEQLEPAAQKVYQSAIEVQSYNLLENAIQLYEQALSINPNHFNALFKLAEGYQEMQDFRKAVELYKRAYQLDSNRFQEGYVQSLEYYGTELIERGYFELAQEQFTPILIIQHDHVLAQEKLQEIETYLLGDIAGMKSKVSEIKSELSNMSYGNFADKHLRNGYPVEFTNRFSSLLDRLAMLVLEASKKFPKAQVDSLFGEGKDLLNVRIRAVSNNKFEKGKEALLHAVSIIEQNLIEYGRKSPIQADSNPVNQQPFQNQSTMKFKVNEIKSELSNTNYDNFAKISNRTGRPVELTSRFTKLLDELDRLVYQASNKFPWEQVDSLFRDGKELLDVRKTAVHKNNFEKGKGILLQAVSIIENNLIDEERNSQPKANQNLVNKNATKSQSTMIFISYNKPQILEELTAVFYLLAQLASESDNWQYKERQQSTSLEAVSLRIDDIRSCSSAIICWPPQDLPDESINPVAYLDLGVCLTLFPKRTLLIYQGSNLPDNLVDKVETFKYLGGLDLQSGMALASQILKVLENDEGATKRLRGR